MEEGVVKEDAPEEGVLVPALPLFAAAVAAAVDDDVDDEPEEAKADSAAAT